MATTRPERPDTGQLHERPTSIPLAAWGAIAAGYAALAWMSLLEPEKPGLSIEWNSSSQFVVEIAIGVGVLLGVRVAWTIFVFFTALTTVFTGFAMVNDPIPQTIGGAVLMAVSLVLALLPSVQRYATGRFRVFVERDTGSGPIYRAMPRLLGAFALLLLIVWWLLPQQLR
ncbi:MAG TPA: hypothetical protein VF029_03080 [Actinomycetota bacterium]